MRHQRSFFTLLLIITAVHGGPFDSIRSAIFGREADVSISDINILLPYSTNPSQVSYILEASGGCFTWSVANEQVAMVKPLYEAQSVEDTRTTPAPCSTR